ncbi:hypothetical protein LTS06_012281, partial [Exophiala xenobiotica]
MAPRYLKTGTRTSEEKKQQVNPQVQSTVKEVIDNIRAQGDNAVRQYSQRFDKWDPASFKLSRAQVEEAMAKVPEQTVKDIKEVQRNVRTFAQ